ncbi:MAG: PQQ-binding-like beta-propeller repeat protein [Pseudomonadales bacterium]
MSINYEHAMTHHLTRIALALLLSWPITYSWATDTEALYSDHCAQCHGANLQGSAHGNELRGSAFKGKWSAQSWQALAALSMATMPPGESGALTAAEHGAIARHIFRANALEAAEPTAAESAEAMAANNSWSGAAGVAEMARSRNNFQNQTATDFKPIDQETLNNPPAQDWLSWRRTLDGQAETPLKQINRRNAKRLGLAWALAMNEGSAQITPLVRNGVMYLVQPGLLVQALKADTGDLIWQYQYPFPVAAKTLGGPMRNFAIYGDKLYIATYDAALIALDAATGELQWRTVKADYTQGYTHSAGPIVGNGVVISGINGCERYKDAGCFITGHDAETGAELWRTSTVQQADSDVPDTWAGLAQEFRAGSDTWIAGSYDSKLDLFYIGTAQAKPWVAASRSMAVADSALYTNSTLALRPKTGELVWYYQHIPGETIDMEVGFERVLATVGGKRYVFTVGKDGVLWQLAADSGQYVAHLETMPQNLFESIDASTGKVTYREDIRNAGIGDTVQVCPGIYGGHNWQSMAYSSARQRLILPLHQLCGEMTGRAVELALGDGGYGGDSKSVPMPEAGDNLGKLMAINVTDKSVAWSHEQPAMFMTGVLTTASGLAFVGDLARYFKAFDTRTGKVVWQTRLAAPTHGYPISYAVDGRQYVAVPTGMGVFRAMTAVVSPQIHQPANGQALYVFALPEN